ncbi:CYTH and CHAD domain-containing protein [Streptomyces paromomycinus]|uniref:CHAD domain-containing protein n=1 Tax=Streptomyces paromomycinus TaxID=92743 RepID=A0A401W931_STREY|nr:CYTH and CHAD domain-containing protein [Streptomyces paromomycinus]GCD45824.1 CHAD domain-containing protein [Streptomyces paromomycinus]
MADTVREIERKYEADDSTELPDLTGVAGVAAVADQGTVVLLATYYDTPDQRLAADGVTLRRRTGGGDAGWHLKLPVAPGVRDEVRTPLADRVPPKLAALVRSRVRGARLAPVAQLRTRRTLRVLESEQGEPVAEVAVDEVVAHRVDGAGPVDGADREEGRDQGQDQDRDRSRDQDRDQAPSGSRVTVGVRWREIEVELVGNGTPALLDAVEEVLAAAGVRPASSASKLARALEETAETAETAAQAEQPPQGETKRGKPSPTGKPAKTSKPTKTSASTKTSKPGKADKPGKVGKAGEADASPRPADLRTAGDAVLAYVREQIRSLVELDPAVRRDVPDSVHQMRVATRRLRSAFRSYGAVLDRSVTDPIGDELKWLAGELGVDRDREVLAERLREGLGELPRELRMGPVAARLRLWSQRRRLGSRQSLLAVLDGTRHLTLLESLHALLADPPLRPAADRPPGRVMVKAVLKDYRRLDRRMAAALAAPPGPERDEALHSARKAAKRVRYAAEAATPVLGRPAKKFATRMKRVQQLLGDHQDSVLARAALRDLAVQAHGAGEGGFSFGLLYGREEAAAAARERELPGVWRKASKPAHRRKLRG